MKEFYGYEDVMKIVGCSKSKAYELIKKLICSFEKDYPDATTIKGRVPIWYFNKKTKTKGDEDVNC